MIESIDKIGFSYYGNSYHFVQARNWMDEPEPEPEIGCQAHSPDFDCRPRYTNTFLMS
jgi:hypothetical protein